MVPYRFARHLPSPTRIARRGLKSLLLLPPIAAGGASGLRPWHHGDLNVVSRPFPPPEAAARKPSSAAMACPTFAGDEAMYGLGIRIGFYLLWFGSVLAGWIARRDTPHVRGVLLLFVAATFLALVIQVGNGALTAVEVYLVLLLVYGAYYAYVPLYLWRLASGCSPFWDPSRWPRVAPGRTYSAANVILLVAVTCFQLWFWTAGLNSIPSTATAGCPEWAFFFAMVQLRNPLFIALNIAINVVLLLCCVAHLCLEVGLVRSPRWLRKKVRKARKRGISGRRRFNLHLLHTVFRVTVAALMIAAVELTLQANNFAGVYDAATAAQLIPLVLASGLLGHILWIFLIKGQGDDSDSDSSSDSSVTAEGVEVIVE